MMGPFFIVCSERDILLVIGGCDDYENMVNTTLAVDLSGKTIYYEYIVSAVELELTHSSSLSVLYTPHDPPPGGRGQEAQVAEMEGQG